MSMRSPLFAEDLVIGTVIDLGDYTMNYEEIIDFAQKWDPQSFHTDDVAARSGQFGGIIASGLHTLSVFHRLAVLGAYDQWAIVAGRSLREVQMPRPVRPGMTLRGKLTIQSVDFNRPHRALVTKLGQLTHQGEPVLTLATDTYLRRRPA